MIDYEVASADPFWMRTTLDMTPEDMVEAFVIKVSGYVQYMMC